MEEIVAVARPDNVDPGLGDTQDPSQVVGVAPVQHDKGVVAGATRAGLVGKFGDERHLAQPGGVALGHHRGVGGDVLEQRRHEPDVVGVDDVGIEGADDGLQVVAPAGSVALDLPFGHGAEDGARVGHDIAHPGHGKRQPAPAEDEGVDALGAEAADLGCEVVLRHPDHHPLLPTHGGGVSHHGVESDSAAGQRRSLGK